VSLENTHIELSPLFPHNSRIAKSPSTRSPRPSGSVPQKTDGRLGRLVQVLQDHATVVVSGTKLADEIGSSRSEVWRLVQQLRAMGVEIAGHPSSGYQLKAVPDLLLPDILAPLVRGTIFGEHIHHYFKIGSTNTAAMEAGAAGAPEGSVFLAEQQTAGRGRGGHSWDSAQSAGICCSLLLRPVLPPSQALILSLAAGLAVHEAVRQVDPAASPDLKWPNDLLLSGKKFCGILTEMNAEATRVRYVVIGIGVNVSQAKFPAELEASATSLRLATGRLWSRIELCAALLKSLDRKYRDLLTQPDARKTILRHFEEHSSMVRGCAVRVEENGEIEGTTEGLDPDGFLRIRAGSALRVVLSGTVRTI
jgi:BirA family biotin operon repressor/biotin-[acetyl-CoA-carboxylase] ligase